MTKNKPKYKVEYKSKRGTIWRDLDYQLTSLKDAVERVRDDRARYLKDDFRVVEVTQVERVVEG